MGISPPGPDDQGGPAANSSEAAQGKLADVADKPPDSDPAKAGPASSAPPQNPSSDPFHLSQEDIERRYYNESFLGTPVTQNQHEALREGIVAGVAGGAAAALVIESMTEGAAVGSVAGPLGAAVGAGIGAVVGGGLGMIAGMAVGTQKDKAQGIPPLSPSQRR